MGWLCSVLKFGQKCVRNECQWKTRERLAELTSGSNAIEAAPIIIMKDAAGPIECLPDDNPGLKSPRAWFSKPEWMIVALMTTRDKIRE